MVKSRAVKAILAAGLLAAVYGTAIAAQQSHSENISPDRHTNSAAPHVTAESGGNKFGDKNISTSAAAKLDDELAALARAKGLEKTPKVKQAIAILTNKILADAYKADFMQNISPSESEISDYYRLHKSDYDLYSLSHILVRFEQDPSTLSPDEAKKVENNALIQAQAIKDRIMAGADFHELATQLSGDTNSRADGGRVPETVARYLAPEFKPRVLLTKKGEVTPPVKSAFGYHLIRVDNMIPGSIDRNRADIIDDIREDKFKEKEISLINSR